MKKHIVREPFGERMHQSRISANLTQKVVCQRLGCSQSNLSDLEKVSKGLSLVTHFARLYGVNPHWLATGEGDKNLKIGASLDNELVLTQQEYRLLELFRAQESTTLKSLVLDLLDERSKRQAENAVKTS